MYIGPFEILREVGEVANELALPPALSTTYPVIHVWMLCRFVPYEYLVLSMIQLSWMIVKAI